jgi:hypothetical protein
MGCEGGVTVYDAAAIEAQFGANVWERTGFGRRHRNPMVTIGGKRVLLGSFNTCADYDYGDPIAAVADEMRWRTADERRVEVLLQAERAAFRLSPGERRDYATNPPPADWTHFVEDRTAEGLAFAIEVACWAVEHASLACVETWT